MEQNELLVDNNSNLPYNDKDVSKALTNKSTEILCRVLDSSVDDTKGLVADFNANESKRGMLRMAKLNNLYDKVTDQIMKRFEQTPENFSNEDLIKYMKITQEALKITHSITNSVVEEPAVQVQNNTQINVNTQSQFDTESRQKIINALNSFMTRVKNNNVVDVETTPVTDENSREEKVK